MRLISMARIANKMTWIVAPAAYLHKANKRESVSVQLVVGSLIIIII